MRWLLAFFGAAGLAFTAHADDGLPQMAVATFPSQLFWLAITFGALYLILAGAVLPRIEQGMTARARHISDVIADARQLRDEAETHKTHMASATDAAYKSAHVILNQAAAAAQDLANDRNDALEATMAEKLKVSEERIAAMRMTSIQAMHEAAQSLLPTVVQKLAALQLSDAQVASAVADAEGQERPSLRGAA